VVFSIRNSIIGIPDLRGIVERGVDRDDRVVGRPQSFDLNEGRARGIGEGRIDHAQQGVARIQKLQPDACLVGVARRLGEPAPCPCLGPAQVDLPGDGGYVDRLSQHPVAGAAHEPAAGVPAGEALVGVVDRPGAAALDGPAREVTGLEPGVRELLRDKPGEVGRLIAGRVDVARAGQAASRTGCRYQRRAQGPGRRP
jgi:hypothetical protein